MIASSNPANKILNTMLCGPPNRRGSEDGREARACQGLNRHFVGRMLDRPRQVDGIEVGADGEHAGSGPAGLAETVETASARFDERPGNHAGWVLGLGLHGVAPVGEASWCTAK